MTGIELFSTILLVFVCIFVALAIGYLVYLLFKTKTRLIAGGLDDAKCKKHYDEDHAKSATFYKVAGVFVNTLIGVLFTGLFAYSVYVNVIAFDEPISLASPKVVMSGSMSEKHKDATYLVKNNLNDQFQVYDIVILEKLPDEFELKQYDIVVYTIEDTQVIHRIINIEEPTAEHPGHRWFQLRGDANPRADSKPVIYSQMKGIYRGNRIQYVGLFVAFFQSALGYLTFAIILTYLFISPFAERKYEIVIYTRLAEIGYIEQEELEALKYHTKYKKKGQDEKRP